MKLFIIIAILLLSCNFSLVSTQRNQLYLRNYQKEIFLNDQAETANSSATSASNSTSNTNSNAASTTNTNSNANSSADSQQSSSNNTGSDTKSNDKNTNQSNTQPDSNLPPYMQVTVCDYKTLYNVARNNDEQCWIATHVCEADLVNWFRILFCTLENTLWLFIIISILIIYIIFVFTSATVDEYIAEGITALSEAMGLSDAMAAVTLIALANGAGDVITALVASGSDGGVSYNIGSLYGSGFFVCAFVIAATIMIYVESQHSINLKINQQKKDENNKHESVVIDKNKIYVKLESELFYRDLVIYIIATVVTIIFAITGEIQWYYCVIFLGIYLIQIIVVAVQDKQAENKIKREKEQFKQRFETGRNNALQIQNQISKDKLRRIRRYMKRYLLINRSVNKFQKMGDYRKMEREEREAERENEFENRSFISQFTFLVDYLPNIARLLTMPPTKAEEYNKYRVMWWPFPGLTFIFWAFGISWWWALKAGLPLACVLTALLIWSHHAIDKRQEKHREEQELKRQQILKDIRKIEREAIKGEDGKNQNIEEIPAEHLQPLIPKHQLSSYHKYKAQVIDIDKKMKEESIPSYFLLIQVVSSICGLIWCFITISILVDLLNCFIGIFKLNNTFMGLTILGIGNALPDALTTIALSKQGYAYMGICGGYSGQLFGLLVGFGIAQLKTTLAEGPQPFPLFTEPVVNLLDMIVLLFALTMLIFTVIYGVKFHFKFYKGLSVVLLIVYAAFFAICVAIQIWYIAGDVKGTST